MSMYMYLAVVALLVLPTDSFNCVLPNEIEYTKKIYEKNDYYSISLSVERNMLAYTRYSLDENNKTIISGRFVKDYNVMIQFHIHPNGTCTQQKLTEDLPTEIPDSAVRLDQFPLRWPYKVPDKTEYWSFKKNYETKIIVAVGRIQPKVCIPRAMAIYHTTEGLLCASNLRPEILDMAAFAVGNYSLIISNKKVFQVPPECLPQNG